MINNFFYIKNNQVKTFLKGSVAHYPVRTRTEVIETIDYVVKHGDTMYTLAKDFFGDDSEYNWTIIADLNYLREPDELVAGETIKIPTLIISDVLRPPLKQYSNASDTAAI